MPSLLSPEFLFKVSFCWGLFALLYAALLRKETFHHANRIYLLAALLGSIVLASLPASEIGQLLPQVQISPDYLLPEFIVGSAAGKSGSVQYLEGWNAVWVLYLAGCLFQAGRFLWGVAQLYRMKNQGRAICHTRHYTLVELEGINGPFSFFRWVFLPSELLEKTDHEQLQPVLAHERAHVRALHSADVLLLEILSAIFWFHPLAYWYKKALRTVHEYEADAAASLHIDKKQYGLLLIRQSQSGMSTAFSHHFFQSPLKQRLIMLTKQTSAPVNAVKFGLAVPLVLFFILLFRQVPVLAQQNSDPFGGAPASKSSFAQPEYPGGMESLSGFLQNNLHYPESAKALKAEGTVLVTFVVKEDGSLDKIAAVEGPKKVLPELEAEALRVVRAMPKWIPAVKEGKIVATEFKLPIRFALEQEKAGELFDLDQKPEYPGGNAALSEFIGKNIQYPAAAQKENAAGLVIIRFVVEKDGSLSHFETLKSPRPDFAEEAIRVLKLLPHFSPGLKDGQPVRVSYTLPVRFKL